MGKSFCEKYSNVPRECPIMCGKCKPGNAAPGGSSSGGSGSGSSGASLPACSGPDPSHCGKEQPTATQRATAGPTLTCPRSAQRCAESAQEVDPPARAVLQAAVVTVPPIPHTAEKLSHTDTQKASAGCIQTFPKNALKCAANANKRL